MILKSRSIATKLLLASSLSAVIVVVAIVAFVKLSLIPQLTNKALENQTVALVYMLKEVFNKPEQWSEEALAKDDLLDPYSNNGKTVATIFLFKNGEYVRMATTLKKEDGSRAIGSVLEPGSDASNALKAGQEFSGYITVYK